MLNLVQIQDKLKDMPTRAIMAYANGQNPMVPPYLALGELNRRKQMEQSAMGEQARQGGEPPTIKQATEEQLGLMNLQKQKAMMAQQNMGQAMANAPSPVPAGVGEEPVQMARGGLTQLPIRNIHRQAYATGGIVAFDKGGNVAEEIYSDYLKGNPSPDNLKLIEDYINSQDYSPAEPVVEKKAEPKRQVVQGKDYSKLDPEVARALYEQTMIDKKSKADNLQLLTDYVNREKEKPEEKPLTGKTGKAAAQKDVASALASIFSGSESPKSLAYRKAQNVSEPTLITDRDAGTAAEDVSFAASTTKQKPVIQNQTSTSGIASVAPQKQPAAAPLTGADKYEAELKKRGLDVMPEAGKGIEALRQSRELYTREPDWIEGLTKAVQDMKAGQAVGSTRMREEKENRQALADLNLKIAAAEDLKVKSDYEFNRGNFDKAVEYERKAQELANQAMTARAHLISASKPSEFQQKIELYTKNPKLYSELFPKENPLVVAAAKEYFDKEILYKKDYPTVQDFLAAKGLTSSTQAGTPPAMPKEGDVAKSKSGKDIVFRGGNWEYK